MSLNALRWLLSPRTSFLAFRMRRAHGHAMSHEVAWRVARVRLRPDEAPYRDSGHAPPV